MSQLKQVDEGGFEPTGPHPNFEGGEVLGDDKQLRSQGYSQRGSES